MEDGLSGADVHTMMKDAKGFLWVGSDGGGFCRFDGASFKEYFPDPNDRNTTNSERITSFTEDSLNNIWIGTDKGLSRFDFKADTFTNFSPLHNPGAAIVLISSGGIMVPIGSTKDTLFCMEPGGWITAFNIHTLKRKPLIQLSREIDASVVWNSNKSFFDPGSNSIWKLSGYEQGGVIEQIFLHNGETNRYSWPCYRRNVQHHHNAEDMVYDSKRNSIWVNTDDGLLEFSLIDKQFRKIDAFNELVKTQGYKRGVGIDIDIYGRVWLSTFYNGIFIYDPKTKAARPVFSDPDLQKKAGQANLHIYCDRDGIVWTSNYSKFGIYEILPHHPPIERFTANPKMKDSLSNHAIYKIIPAHGEMWIGTEDGLNIFDTKTDQFRVLRQKDLPGISGNFIVPVYVDTIRQKALVRSATSTANVQEMDLYEMDLKTRQCKPIVFRDGTKRLDTISARPEWFLRYKNGLIFCDEKHGIFEIKENSLFANLVIPIKSLYGGMVLEEDRFIFLRAWGSAPNLTFENKNGKWIKTTHMFDSLKCGIFYNKKDRTHWLSFKYELVHYSKDLRKIKTYRQEDGYKGWAFSMLLDDDDNLWFANSLNQICRLNTTTGIITTISETEGYQKQNFDGHASAAKDEQGRLYFGAMNGGTTTGGLDRIEPERYSSATTSSVYLRSLEVNQKPFARATGVNNLHELSLNYDENVMSIETGIIDYYAKGKGRLRYLLEANGKNGDWQYAPAYYTIRYEGLQPGSYRLVMQSSNAGNEFNSPLKILVINISAPFWETWWFRIFALIFLVDLVYTIVRWRLRQKFKLQLERSEKERQIADIKQKATELEMQALRAQMNPHFIFNSLNSINRFILQNNRAQASEYLTKFSKLVRMILQNSQASLISLESELESLNLYLDLEVGTI